MTHTLRIARKEFAGFFASPVAFLFLGAFLAATLFAFFWVETFFARNLADVRPLFEWLPLLLIFLVAAVTMRSWSEERRAGTLEFLLASPVSGVSLVLGKFLACLGLVAVALALTLPLPLMVALIGPLDGGPVFGGYLAALFLAAAYAAIGLFVSARSANQIVSLIGTVLICGGFYLLGSDALTGLFGHRVGELLHLLGAGSRFASITRGVIDLRDLYYYLSLVGVFLSLNVLALEALRWAGNPRSARHRHWYAITGLAIANLLAANLWLAPLGGARVDLTQGQLYSLSPATRGYLAQLREPLLIRGYFSAQTHPLLAPLVPQLRDLLAEYAEASEGRARVEVIDPADHPELEREANEKYGIEPVPFQFASKYQASVVNAYFNLLVRYGDQYQMLDFQDLIELKLASETDLEVALRNPEYDLTQAIRQVLFAYQGGGRLFEQITAPVSVRGYVSAPERLPEPLRSLRTALEDQLAAWQGEAGGRLSVELIDPAAAGPALVERLRTDYGFRPMAASLLDTETFWFYLVLESAGRTVQVALPESLTAADLTQALEAGLKRFSQGLLKTVALHAPQVTPRLPQLGLTGGGPGFSLLREVLGEDHNLISTDLDNGQVPEVADILVLAAPAALDERQLFAIDQFLMRGGTVVLASSPFSVTTTGALEAREHTSGLEDWLRHHGITLEPRMVLDPQNAAFPIPVNRDIGGFVVRETQLIDYPYFVDVRGAGLADPQGLTAGLDQVTLTWASPVRVELPGGGARHAQTLLASSPQAWTSAALDIQPDFAAHGRLGFPQLGERGEQPLAVRVEGRFDSYFAGQPSPLLATAGTAAGEGGGPADDPTAGDLATGLDRVIERSAESARILLFGSNSFLSDELLDLAAAGLGTSYLTPIELIENAIDASLEDRGLLEIRGRAQFSRLLLPLDAGVQMAWEALNYVLAALGLLGVWLLRRRLVMRARRRALWLVADGATARGGSH